MKTTSLLAVILLTSCATLHNDDIVRKPKEDGSIETVMSVRHHGNYDLLTTTHKVWVNGIVDKIIVETDTLKSLGTTKQVVEDSFGVAEKKTLPKNYEIYITVK